MKLIKKRELRNRPQLIMAKLIFPSDSLVNDLTSVSEDPAQGDSNSIYTELHVHLSFGEIKNPGTAWCKIWPTVEPSASGGNGCIRLPRPEVRGW
jgi:hypothetical protein